MRRGQRIDFSLVSDIIWLKLVWGTVLIQKGKWLEEGQMVVLASETMLPIISVSPKVGNSASFWNLPLYPVTTPPSPHSLLNLYHA